MATLFLKNYRNIFVGTGVPDCPRMKSACFLYGYWCVAICKAKIYASWTVEDAGPYKFFYILKK